MQNFPQNEFGIVRVIAFASLAFADGWPQWMGPKRDGVWREQAIDALPAAGLPQRWRVPTGAGYSSAESALRASWRTA